MKMGVHMNDVKTSLTDGKAIDDLIPGEWARQMEYDIRILVGRLVFEDDVTFSPEVAEVMSRWAKEVMP